MWDIKDKLFTLFDRISSYVKISDKVITEDDINKLIAINKQLIETNERLIKANEQLIKRLTLNVDNNVQQTVEHKQCTSCKQFKPYSEYQFKLDGVTLYKWCKTCCSQAGSSKVKPKLCLHKECPTTCSLCIEIDSIIKTCRGSTSGAFRRPNSTIVIKHLGCNMVTFRQHIATTFKDGMTFENYGEWHIDHIIPLKCAIDTERTVETVIKRLHYTNTQALWAADNLSKGNRLVHM